MPRYSSTLIVVAALSCTLQLQLTSAAPSPNLVAQVSSSASVLQNAPALQNITVYATGRKR
jgi:hypothetical protein